MIKIILIILFILFSNLYAKKNITVYTYHNHAPFIINKDLGLSYELIDILNKNDKYNFTLKIVPRARLNYILKPWINKKCYKNQKCNKDWIVLWVNHKWGFGKDSLKNFSWIKLFNDANVIISSIKNKIQYKSPKDLINKRFLGVAGHKYVGIDKLVNEGKINRINGVSELKNLSLILALRADATLLPKSAFNYYKQTNNKFKSLYVSKINHQNYLRNIMLNKKDKQLFTYIKSLNFSSLDKE